MYSHQVSNSNNGGLAPKIGLLLGQSWMVIPMNKHSPGISPLLIENAEVYMKSTLFTNSYVLPFVIYCTDCLHVYCIF